MDCLYDVALSDEKLTGFALEAEASRRIFATRVLQRQKRLFLRNDAQGAHGASWPRYYQGEVVEITLHLSYTSRGELVLLGILTSSDANEDVEALTGVTAELNAASRPGEAFREQTDYLPLLSTRVDDMGTVVFKDVPTGEYFMMIHLPGSEMIVEGLVIESSAM